MLVVRYDLVCKLFACVCWRRCLSRLLFNCRLFFFGFLVDAYVVSSVLCNVWFVVLLFVGWRFRAAVVDCLFCLLFVIRRCLVDARRLLCVVFEVCCLLFIVSRASC